MRPSRDVAEPIAKAFESCLKPEPKKPGFFHAYRCPANVVTIGWGSTKSDLPTLADDTVLSQAECDDLFTRSSPKYAMNVNRNLQGAQVTQAQFDALWDWSYNTGGPSSSAVWTYAIKGDIGGTCERLMKWDKGGGKVLAGLVRRRKAECELYRGNIDNALKIAGTHRIYQDPMAQKVDRPSPPIAEVVKRAPGATATVGAGTAGAAAGQQSGHDMSGIAIAAGIIVAVIGVVIFVIAFNRIRSDWA